MFSYMVVTPHGHRVFFSKDNGEQPRKRARAYAARTGGTLYRESIINIMRNAIEYRPRWERIQ